MYHFKLFLSLIFLLITLSLSAQYTQIDEEKPKAKSSFKDNLVLGGNLGLSFGSVTNVLINPQIGYKFTDNFMLGTGGTYQYFRINDRVFGNFESEVIGVSFYGRHKIYEKFFAHAEFENLWLDYLNPFDFSVSRESVPIFLVGGGYIESLGGSTSFVVSVLFDAIGDERSPYINPIFRGGVILGF